MTSINDSQREARLLESYQCWVQSLPLSCDIPTLQQFMDVANYLDPTERVHTRCTDQQILNVIESLVINLQPSGLELSLTNATSKNAEQSAAHISRALNLQSPHAKKLKNLLEYYAVEGDSVTHASEITSNLNNQFNAAYKRLVRNRTLNNAQIELAIVTLLQIQFEFGLISHVHLAEQTKHWRHICGMRTTSSWTPFQFWGKKSG